MCAGTISEDEVKIPLNTRKGEKLNLTPGAPNDDFTIYDKICSKETQGEGVFITPQFTIKVPESVLEEKRKEFWSKSS